MSKKLKFLATMLTCILLSINQVFATDDVSTITSSSFEGLTSHWSASANAGGYNATKGAQITKAKTGLTLTATDFTNVTSISVTCSKSKNGAGAVTIKAGANSASKTSFTTSPDALTLTPASSYTGTITIAITCTTSSIYIKTITVVYTSGSTKTLHFINHKKKCFVSFVSFKNLHREK